ncbi:MAG: 2-phosphosulfolactate phosphatase [Bacteroidia bacterium]|nr:2-phosphosulfolactate phosphatase [Bacteroidia bacterium]
MLPLFVCPSPLLLPSPSKLKEAIVVVIDILRATTSICACLHNGAMGIIPLETVAEALLFKRQEYLIAGERNGYKIEGFDFGNSPSEFSPERVKGKKIAMATTNGTRAIRKAQKAHQVIAGAFSNFSMLCNYLRNQNRPLYLLCAGWQNEVALEDMFFAGALCHALVDAFYLEQDAAHIARQIYLNESEKQNLLLKASHLKRLHNFQKQNDIQLCFAKDIYPTLPYLNKQGEIISLLV